MKLECIAVDDEPLALALIEDYVKKIPYLHLLKTFDNAMESLEFLKSNRVDLIILDIQMDELSGIQMVKLIKQHPMIIFTTAYDKYAIEGFELNVLDYLLKPISFERFLKAVEKAYDYSLVMNQEIQPSASQSTVENKADDFFFVKTEFKLKKVRFDEILYIEGMADYLQIYTIKEKIITLQSFKNIESVLPLSNFCRVHKSFIVAIDKINTIEKNQVIVSDRAIPISRTYHDQFYALLNRKKVL